MKTLSLVIAALLVGCASLGTADAARIAKDGAGNHVRLTNEQCTSTAGVLATIPPHLRAQARAASVYWQGKNYAACYIEQDGVVYIVDEEGDGARLPAQNFVLDVEA